MKTAKINWKAEATRIAEEVADTMFSIHRGVMPWTEDGVSVVYGNDRYVQDETTRRYVDALWGWLRGLEIKILGFGLDRADGYSWAMLVRSDDLEGLIHLLRGFSGGRVNI